MRIIADTREQKPWTFEGLGDVEIVRAKLETGDYSLEGLEDVVCIERKSLDDFTGSVMAERQRFYRELGRMRYFKYSCVIIEAGMREIMDGFYTSRVKPEAVRGFIAQISVEQQVPVLLGGSRPEAQMMAYDLLSQCAKKIT